MIKLTIEDNGNECSGMVMMLKLAQIYAIYDGKIDNMHEAALRGAVLNPEHSLQKSFQKYEDNIKEIEALIAKMIP